MRIDWNYDYSDFKVDVLHFGEKASYLIGAILYYTFMVSYFIISSLIKLIYTTFKLLFSFKSKKKEQQYYYRKVKCKMPKKVC